MTAAASASADDRIARGELLLKAAGCANCHTDAKRGGKPLAGGVQLKTPFGTFHAPNITPHPEHGIGRWSDEDFIRAMRHGIAPDGSHYYPAFPYTSYTRMTEADMRAIKAYIFSLPPVDRRSEPHDLGFPFNQRWGMWAWKQIYFLPGAFAPDRSKSEKWNRGAYLVTAVGHCGECHTPRDRLGGLYEVRWLSGTTDGPEGETVPNITPDQETGIGTWSAGDVRLLLSTGLLPDGDVVGGSMYPVIEDGTDALPEDDQRAIAEYLFSLPSRENPAAPATKAE